MGSTGFLDAEWGAGAALHLYPCRRQIELPSIGSECCFSPSRPDIFQLLRPPSRRGGSQKIRFPYGDLHPPSIAKPFFRRLSEPCGTSVRFHRHGGIGVPSFTLFHASRISPPSHRDAYVNQTSPPSRRKAATIQKNTTSAPLMHEDSRHTRVGEWNDPRG